MAITAQSSSGKGISDAQISGAGMDLDEERDVGMS